MTGVFDTYVQSAEHRNKLRKALPLDQPCPYAIRQENT